MEEAFLQRNYGNDYGQLYKPDSISMGGGRGNGRDFDMDQWRQDAQDGQEEQDGQDPGPRRRPYNSDGFARRRNAARRRRLRGF